MPNGGFKCANGVCSGGGGWGNGGGGVMVYIASLETPVGAPGGCCDPGGSYCNVLGAGGLPAPSCPSYTPSSSDFPTPQRPNFCLSVNIE